MRRRRPADRVADGAGDAVRAPPERAPAGGRHRGGELPPLHRPGLPAADQLPRRDGRGGSARRGGSGAPRPRCWPIRQWRSSSTTRTTTSGCWTESTGIRATELFDTRIAAQLLNEPGVGLAALLEKYLGVRLDKRFQRADWSARPLSAEMLEYAASDTRHLPACGTSSSSSSRRAAGSRGRKRSSSCWRTSAGPRPNGEPAYLRLKGAKALKGRELAILRELHEWREGVAQRATGPRSGS